MADATETERPAVVLVTGDRNWWDHDALRSELARLPPRSAVVHGGCKGADAMAGEIAQELGFQERVYPADWDLYGRAAGPIRNQRMLDEEPEISVVIAAHDCLAESKGTADMVRRAKKKGLPVRQVTSRRSGIGG